MVLSDGTALRLHANEGCGHCANGRFELTELNECANIITNVEVVDYEPDGGDLDPGRVYRVFVYAEDRRVNLATFEGSDGNGWYGTGFWVEVLDGTNQN